ncbi:hypothetical protein GCM10008066_17510 [Oxalicibacterium faecigallinarum]|uniref:Lipoprotein n=1 Tax=Oxalicibacterium faecigallinarum TaxID=573741 RepID=A0A8J3AY58_9BURK|nr:hypothetical protein GCM10008066_17510 [Oxalicibacterium faecigallinarum]
MRVNRWFARAGMLAIVFALMGCSGYADQPRAKSGVETYGVIDVGIGSHR